MKEIPEPHMIEKVDVTVAAIIEKDNRFLLVEERTGGKIVLNQPAGHLEPGEFLTDAVTREVIEETGFAFRPTEFLGCYLWHCIEASATFLRFSFCGEATPPAATPILDEGIIATHWLTRHQLMARESELRSPLVMRCIDDFQAGIRYPLAAVNELPLDQIRRTATR